MKGPKSPADSSIVDTYPWKIEAAGKHWESMSLIFLEEYTGYKKWQQQKTAWNYTFFIKS